MDDVSRAELICGASVSWRDPAILGVLGATDCRCPTLRIDGVTGLLASISPEERTPVAIIPWMTALAA